MGGQVWPASAAAGSTTEQSPEGGEEARKKSAVTFWVGIGTIMYLRYAVQAVLDHGDNPALLVLEVSTWLCFLFYLWVVFIDRVLLVTEDHRLGLRALLGVLAWIVGSVAASVLVCTAISTVAGMLLMYLVTLCVTGLLACCLRDYLRTGNSTETTISTSASRQQEKPSTTAPDESQNALLQEKCSAKMAKLAHEHNARDLETGLFISEA